MPSRPASAAAVVVALALAAGAATLLPGAAPPASAEGLVPYASCDALLEHYRAELERTATPYGFGDSFVLLESGAAMDTGARSAAAASGPVAAVGSGPTGTNLQEHGVDEPDRAKTAGDLLLAVANDRLQVVRRGAAPELLGSAPLGEGAWGAELLVDGDRVLVLVPHAYGGPAAAARSMPNVPQASTTTALLFDLGTPSAPRLLESVELDGRYLSARLSDGAVRLVTSSAPSPESAQPAAPYGPAQLEAALEENRQRARTVGLEEVLPQLVRRGPDGEQRSAARAVECAQVRHAPSPRGASTLLVTTLDLGRGLQPRDTTAVTTDGDLVYASTERLYVATSRWGTTAPPPDDRPSDSATVGVQSEVSTELHAFDTSAPDRTTYAGSGSVPGYVLGRWALSSHDGHLRVATTSAPPWGDGPPTASSVAVLEERADGLVQVGRLGGLGVGERIYAVRWFGDLATVVTFRQTDPLYVVDLADPVAPALLGELKVPGFSTYLHPVGDDRLLGVGMDADAAGRTTGVQVSLFDLADRSTPVQLDRLSLGQGWTPAGDDSRAFGYSPERRTALLPYSLWDGAQGRSSALGVRVDGDRLVETGRLEVLAQAPAERVLHDAEHVYAVSSRGVVAGDWSGTRTGAVDFAR